MRNNKTVLNQKTEQEKTFNQTINLSNTSNRCQTIKQMPTAIQSFNRHPETIVSWKATFAKGQTAFLPALLAGWLAGRLASWLAGCSRLVGRYILPWWLEMTVDPSALTDINHKSNRYVSHWCWRKLKYCECSLQAQCVLSMPSFSGENLAICPWPTPGNSLVRCPHCTTRWCCAGKNWRVNQESTFNREAVSIRQNLLCCVLLCWVGRNSPPPPKQKRTTRTTKP